MQQILSVIIISVIFFSSSEVFAQQITMGEPPSEDIKIVIDENGTAHVVHIVQGNNVSPVNVETIQGNMSNFSVTDVDNNTVQYFTVQQSPKAIMIPPTQRNMTLIKYDLTNVLSLNDGVWKWNYFMPSDAPFADFYFPKGVDMIWANDRPVYLGGHGLREHGNGMKLEYVINEPSVSQNVQWQNYNFSVTIRTLSDVGPYTFDQSSMAYAFNISKPNSLVTIIMPQALLGGNYTTHINGNHLLINVFHKNQTHVWIGVRPSTNGTIQITGTTAIPEFPLFVPLVIGITMILVLQFRNRLSA